jgi:hypothetical protein
MNNEANFQKETGVFGDINRSVLLLSVSFSMCDFALVNVIYATSICRPQISHSSAKKIEIWK